MCTGRIARRYPLGMPGGFGEADPPSAAALGTHHAAVLRNRETAERERARRTLAPGRNSRRLLLAPKRLVMLVTTPSAITTIIATSTQNTASAMGNGMPSPDSQDHAAAKVPTKRTRQTNKRTQVSGSESAPTNATVHARCWKRHHSWGRALLETHLSRGRLS